MTNKEKTSHIHDQIKLMKKYGFQITCGGDVLDDEDTFSVLYALDELTSGILVEVIYERVKACGEYMYGDSDE